jgi:hypothetical protein
LPLTRQEKLDAQAIFAADQACPDCGGIHKRACPRIRRQVWVGAGSAVGTRTEVEYWRQGQWDESVVIWPEEAFDPDMEADGG